MQLSIIIVNYNVRHFLEQCLYSVKGAVQHLEAEVFVVDNNSNDGSVAWLQPLFPWVKWIQNNQNTGFGAANNRAVKEATGEYILFLNPDTLLPEDCLQQCISFMKLQPRAGALGIKMLDGSGRFLPESKRGFPSPLTSLCKMAGLASLFPRSRWFARYYAGHLPIEKNNVVEVLAGAFMLVRRPVLQQTGAFDEQFFMYGEDIDLSYRIQKGGWQNWYFAESGIIHFKGESTKKGSLNYVKTFYEAMSLFVRKHYGGKRALLFVKMIEAAIWAKAGLSVVTGTAKKAVRQLMASPVKNRLADTSQSGKTVVVASCAAFAQVQEIFKAAGLKDLLIDRIATDAVAENSIGRVEELPRLLKTTNVKELVFCLDKHFTMKEAIAIMQQHSNLPFAFYYCGSRCIISSSSKATSGQWIAI